MSKTICKNPECKKKVKRTGKFCSVSCFSIFKKINPEKYKKGTFKKGESSWNKGKKFTKVGDTFIRKKITKTGANRSRRFVCCGYNSLGQPKYIRNDKYIWLLANGSIPKGHVIYHKDGRTLNDELENLECIPFGEALSRYALHKNDVFNLGNKNHVSQIIQGCERGDRKIQKQLFEMMHSKMFAVAMRYSSGYDAAEDVMSDAFVKVFKNIKKVRVESGNLEGWIRRIIVNTAIDSIRKNNKIENLTDSIDDEEHEYNYVVNQISLDENFSEDMDSKYIMEMIQRLSPGYRTVFNMYVIDGCQHKEIAKQLNISEGTSKANLSKAKAILREMLLKFNKEEEDGILNLEAEVY